LLACFLIINFIFLFYLKENGKSLILEPELVITLPYHNKSFDFLIEEGELEKEIVVNDLQDYGEPIFFSITNTGNKEIKPQLIVNSHDWFSNKSILNDALSAVNKKNASDEEIILAIWKFVIGSRYNFIPAINKTDFNFFENPIQYFNSWGYGFCSDSATIFAQLNKLAGYKARIVYIKKHVVAEVYYNLKWHMFDVDRGLYYRNKGGGIASIDEIYQDLSLLNQTIVDFDKPKWLYLKQIEAFSKIEQTFWNYENYFYPKFLPNNFFYKLKPKDEIRFYYNWPDKYYWQWKSDEPKIVDNIFKENVYLYTNGLLLTPIINEKGSIFWRENIININTQLPYPILGSYIYKKNLCKIFPLIDMNYSFDGDNWQKVKLICKGDKIDLSKIFLVGKDSQLRNEYYLRLPKQFNNGMVYTQFQVAPFSIPKLKNANNLFRLKNKLDENIKIEFGFFK